MYITDSILKHYLRNCYFINGTAYAGKSTMCAMLAERFGMIVSSCVCVIIPNLTRGVRPYAFVENVVTHADHRGKGYATACLHYARELAQKAGCYKMMLLTGSKSPGTMAFYENAGYNSSDKTAFVQWL